MCKKHPTSIINWGFNKDDLKMFDKPFLLSSVQSKIHAARSLSEIAIDLTETGTLKTSKLANMGSKGKIISGSSGSLLSSG